MGVKEGGRLRHARPPSGRGRRMAPTIAELSEGSAIRIIVEKGESSFAALPGDRGDRYEPRCGDLKSWRPVLHVQRAACRLDNAGVAVEQVGERP